MPEMGRAPTQTQTKLKNVTIGRARPPKNNNRIDPTAQKNDKYNSKLVDKLTNHKPKSIYKEGPHNQMGKNEFLKLLSHQLQNQDPMNPMDQSKFSADLAQFAQLEQLSNMNTKFDKLNPNVQVEDKFYGASFLGKKVITSGSSVDYKGGGQSADVFFNTDKPAEKLVVRILDDQNNIIYEEWKDKVDSGSHRMKWDGNDLAGNPEKAGKYRVAIQAWDKTGGQIPVETKTQGVVESVYFDDGETVLLVEGQKVFLRDVDSFHVPRVDTKKALDSATGKLDKQKPKEVTRRAINSYENNAPVDQTNYPKYDYSDE